MKLYAPSWPNRSAPLGTTIRRSKPTVPDWFWFSGAGRVIFNAVQATSSAPAVPPVTLDTVIGVLDGQVPWKLSHSRRYTSVSATGEALTKLTLSCPVQVKPAASLVRFTVYDGEAGVRVASVPPPPPPDTVSATSSTTKLVCALAFSTPVNFNVTVWPI